VVASRLRAAVKTFFSRIRGLHMPAQVSPSYLRRVLTNLQLDTIGERSPGIGPVLDEAGSIAATCIRNPGVWGGCMSAAASPSAARRHPETSANDGKLELLVRAQRNSGFTATRRISLLMHSRRRFLRPACAGMGRKSLKSSKAGSATLTPRRRIYKLAPARGSASARSERIACKQFVSPRKFRDVVLAGETGTTSPPRHSVDAETVGASNGAKAVVARQIDGAGTAEEVERSALGTVAFLAESSRSHWRTD